MQVYPAIDIKGGRVVRLMEGDVLRETTYDLDPVAQAEAFAAAGASWLHVVDMDRAFGTGNDNLDSLRRICRLERVRIQVGGDIVSDAWAREAVDAGASRIVLGTRALLEPALFDALLDVVGVERAGAAIDVRGGRPAARGWAAPLGVSVLELADRAGRAGLAAVIYRDLERDGRLAGPDVAGAALLVGRGLDVVLAGGVSGLDDIEAARRQGIAGVVVGRALHEGRFALSEALQCSQ